MPPLNYDSVGVATTARSSRVSATPDRIAAAPASLVAVSGSPRTMAATAIATIGTMFEYIDVWPPPSFWTAVYQITYAATSEKSAE